MVARSAVFDEAVVTAPPEALAAATSVARRVRDREAQVRRLFVEKDTADPDSPMGKMLKGGRGGSVRLRLYLSFLWFASNPPYDVTYPARAWAQLLGLPDPEVKGARRISDALAWLKNNDFIKVQQRPGLPSRVTLKSELGNASDYSVPGAMWRTLDTKDLEARRLQRYLRVPPTFWTSGWLAILSGPAVAMFLVILAENGPTEKEWEQKSIWFSPSEAKARYGMSEDTRSAGLRELVRAGIIHVKRRPINADAFDFRRTRNVYQLDLSRLDEHARL